MASIKFNVVSDKANASIYVRFSTGRKHEVRQKTGLTIPSPKDDWSEVKQFPKTNTAENKLLNSKLKSLEVYIHERYNKDYNNSEIEVKEFKGEWLRSCINDFFGRTSTGDTDCFLSFAKSFVESMTNRSYIIKGTKKNYSSITIEKYKNVVNHLQAFEEFSNKDTIYRRSPMNSQIILVHI